MAETDNETPAPPPALPDYVLDPDAVLKDTSVPWRYGKAPDYSNTRAFYAETKTRHHPPSSLPDLVENLVKNWEVEASHKSLLSTWRTISPSTYTFSLNGGAPQSGEHMLAVGTYNALIPPNQFYSPEHMDFAASHRAFKSMMPVFAWEVLEVYVGPPKVVFKWRHWGQMVSGYEGVNDKGEKVTAKGHGGMIDIQGLAVAEVDEQLRLKSVEVWFDPIEMFRQMAPDGLAKDGGGEKMAPAGCPFVDGVGV